MSNGRLTYRSIASRYNLDASRVAEVIGDLNAYVLYAKKDVERNNPEMVSPSVRLVGNGRELVLSTEAADMPGYLRSFDLVKLVFGTKGDKLTMQINAHKAVAIDPQDLYALAEEYKKR